MPASDSTVFLPPCSARHIDQMTPGELSALKEWASALRASRCNTGVVAAQASALSELLDLRDQALAVGAQALVDMRINRLLDDLAEAGLTP